MELQIPRPSRDSLTVSVGLGEQLFVVGANGTGKSALFHYWSRNMGVQMIKRIAAHRQTWFNSGNLELTACSRKDFERNVRVWDGQDDARWMEHGPTQRQSAVLFDLVAKDNTRYRTIGQYMDDDRPDEAAAFASKSESTFKQLNDLLSLGTLTVSLSNSNDEEILAQHSSSGRSFSLAQMSDGERAAALMAVNVLTVKPGTTLLIDEPERHLHRSIIEPFLSALFAKRQDCVFVISTHEIALPIANREANVIVLRSCAWNGNQSIAWDAEVLESGAPLPEDLRRDVLGARRRILFVEGTANSREMPLYGASFPVLSVIPKGSYSEVIRAVNGLRSSQEHHHVEAFGLIDKDARQPDDIEKLANSGIFALEVCSVESLYYCTDAISAVGSRQMESLGGNEHELALKALHKALEAIDNNADIAERMAARRSEGRIRNQVERLTPDWRAIKQFGERLSISLLNESPYPEELRRFNDLVNTGDWDGLVSRYPLRESNVFDTIARAIRCVDRADYERMVVTRIRKDEDLARRLKRHIKPLAELIDAEP